MIFTLLIAQNQFIGLSELIHKKVHSWWLHGYRVVPNLLFALIVFVLFLIIAGFLKRIFYKLFVHFFKSKSLAGLLSGIFNLFMIVAGIYIGLNILRLDKIAISVLAGAGIIGLTLAFAFQDLTSNFISGVFMDLNRPFEVGDIIGSGSLIGEVEATGLRSTTIRTPEGLLILVPNKNIFQNPITNYRKSLERKLKIDFSVPLQMADPELENEIISLIGHIKIVDTERKVDIYYTDFDQTNLKTSVLFWIKSSNELDNMEAKDQAIKAILKALKGHQKGDSLK